MSEIEIPLSERGAMALEGRLVRAKAELTRLWKLEAAMILEGRMEIDLDLVGRLAMAEAELTRLRELKATIRECPTSWRPNERI